MRRNKFKGSWAGVVYRASVLIVILLPHFPSGYLARILCRSAVKVIVWTVSSSEYVAVSCGFCNKKLNA